MYNLTTIPAIIFTFSFPEIIGYIIYFCFYFIPSINAAFRKHSHLLAITLFNLCFGVTVIGWFAALVYSVKLKKPGILAWVLFSALFAFILYVDPCSNPFKTSCWPSQVQHKLRSLSVALEEYAHHNQGKYPADIQALSNSEFRINENFCGEKLLGHTFKCNISPNGYSLTAQPDSSLKDFETPTIKTGGILLKNHK